MAKWSGSGAIAMGKGKQQRDGMVLADQALDKKKSGQIGSDRKVGSKDPVGAASKAAGDQLHLVMQQGR